MQILREAQISTFTSFIFLWFVLHIERFDVERKLCVRVKFTLLSFDLLICMVLSVNKSRIARFTDRLTLDRVSQMHVWILRKRNRNSNLLIKQSDRGLVPTTHRKYTFMCEASGDCVFALCLLCSVDEIKPMINACARNAFFIHYIFRDLFQLSVGPWFVLLFARFVFCSPVITYLRSATRWTLLFESDFFILHFLHHVWSRLLCDHCQWSTFPRKMRFIFFFFSSSASGGWSCATPSMRTLPIVRKFK